MARLLLLAALVALASAGCGATGGLPAGVTRLPGIDPSPTMGGPSPALAPVRVLARDADIVGIGESAHGSAGYARLQHGMVRELIEHEGYRTLMVEILSDEDRLAAAFVTCEPDELRRALYHQGWKDFHQERLDLYTWLCAYNQAHPDDPVHVRSFDPQKPWEDARALRAFVSAAATPDVTATETVRAIDASCFGAQYDDQLGWAFSPETTAYFADQRLDPAAHAACVAATDALAAWLVTLAPIRPGLGDAQVALASLRAWEDKSFRFFEAPAEALAIRETQMAANLLWRWRSDARGPQKTIVLAHNLHVAKTAVPPSAKSPAWDGLSSLGERLVAAIGPRYRAIAITGYQVAAIFNQTYPAPTGADSLEARLVTTGAPALLVRTDVRWVAAQPWSIHDEDEPAGRRYDLARAFDLVAFLAEAPAAVMLPKPE